MFTEDDGAAETAIAFTDQFLDAGVAKLDAAFGAGYAKANPQALAAYVAACASNVGAFMTAAVAMQEDAEIEAALAAFDDELAPKPKGRRR